MPFSFLFWELSFHILCFLQAVPDTDEEESAEQKDEQFEKPELTGESVATWL